jgi:hypothetical protein
MCSYRSPELSMIPKKDLLVHHDNCHLVLINAEDPNQCTSLILTLIIWLDLIVKCQIEFILMHDNFWHFKLNFLVFNTC